MPRCRQTITRIRVPHARLHTFCHTHTQPRCARECVNCERVHRSKHILALPQWEEVRQGTDIRVCTLASLDLKHSRIISPPREENLVRKVTPNRSLFAPSFLLLPSLFISVSNSCAETLDLLRAFISSLEILIIVSPTSSLASIFSQFSIIDGKEDVPRNIPLIFFYGMILQNFESITNVPLSNRI